MQSRIIIVFLLIVLVSCGKSKKKGAVVSKVKKVEIERIKFSNTPKHLIMLTKIDEEWVVFKPCNAENGELKINEKKILWLEGHEAEELHIKNIEEITNGFSLDIESLGELYKAGLEIFIDEKQSFFRIRNKLYGGNKTRFFVAKELVSNFKIIEQPCKDCWDDCD